MIRKTRVIRESAFHSRHRLRRPSHRPRNGRAIAILRRILARSCHRTRRRVARNDCLSAQHAARRAHRLARQRWPAGKSTRQRSRATCSIHRRRATAILNCLYGIELPFNVDFAAPRPRAPSTTGLRTNGSTRTRGCAPRSCCPLQNIEFRGRGNRALRADQRFVQVMVLAMGEHPLGKQAMSGQSMRQRNDTACPSAFTPDRAIAIR